MRSAPEKPGVRSAIRTNVHVRSQGFVLRVDFQNLFSVVDVWKIQDHTTVEATWAQKGWVKHVRTIGRGNHDDTDVGIKPVHLHQDLVESLFTLVVRSTKSRSALATDGIDLVNEDDAGGAFFARAKRSRTRDAPRRRTSRRIPNRSSDRTARQLLQRQLEPGAFFQFRVDP